MNNGKICISVCAETTEELVAQIRRAEALADVIEVRFDCLQPDQLTAAARAISDITCSKPLIATYRSPEQGGKQNVTGPERLEFWRSLGDGFEFADVEQDIIADVHPASHVIASHHDHKTTPSDLDAIFDRLAAAAPDIIKIATTAHDVCDAIPAWQLLDRARGNDRGVIPIAMGEAGKWTRILALAHGGFWAYASLDSGKETADGQITVDDMANVYRIKDLDRDTRVYGVIGDPVSSSLSPYMHNAAFKAAGLNAVFLPLQVKDLDEFMRGMVLPATREIDLNFAGFAVTMPHKQSIQKYLTSIDPIATAIRAVNTVKIDCDKLAGYNTDAPGFIAPLKKRIPDLKNARVAVLGSGGAARAVVYALRQEQAAITLFARNQQKAQPVGDEFDIQVADLATINHQPSTIDLIINTTPLGMLGPDETKTPLTANELLGVKFVYDLVTRPDDTPLLREARKAGVDAIGGVEMLVAQGEKQFEIWIGGQAPAGLMRQAALDRLK